MNRLRVVFSTHSRRCFSTEALSLQQQQQQLVSTYCQAMGSIASPAMIITTTSANGSEPRGLTLSSITSLSVKPQPMVSFNVQLPSRTSEVLHSRNIFAINVLPASPQSADLALCFAGAHGAHTNPFKKFAHLLKLPIEFAKDKPSIVSVPTPGPGRAAEEVDFKHAQNIPVVANSSAILYCKKHQIFDVQDHEIWVARVFHVDVTGNLDDNGTLLYQNRAFHSLGSKLD